MTSKFLLVTIERKVIVNEIDVYKIEDSKEIGKNKFYIGLNHEKHGYKGHNVELLSKIDDDPVILRIDGRLYKFQLERIDRSNYRVKSYEWARSLQARVLSELTSSIERKKPDQMQAITAKKQITKKLAVKGAFYSPMTGIINSVDIKVGQRVKKGDVIFKLYIMKMENEICAEKSGRVEKILVQTGNGVEEGDPLAIIE